MGDKLKLQALQNPVQWGIQFAKNADECYKIYKNFEGAQSIQDRHRSLQLTLVNATNHKLYLQEGYFDSGTWYKSFPPVIEPNSVVVGGVANKQGSWMTGVCGGLGLRIDGTNLHLALGFCNPHNGSFKLSAFLTTEDNNGKYAFDNAWDNNPKHHQRDGLELQGQQVTSKYAMMGFVWTLKK